MPQTHTECFLATKIGYQHGLEAKVKVLRGINFYEQFLFSTTKQSWAKVCEVAAQFLPLLRRDFPDYLNEVQGLAAGANVPLLSILALNVRTEIAFGMFSDACTALSWKEGNTSFLAQNWDWRQEQKENLIRLCIKGKDKPDIEMITEAGIIGKIGLNSAGVGVCLNAIRARGVDFEKLPCHLALRRCLDSTSREEAVRALQHTGVASSCHILVADPHGGSGLECSSADVVVLPMSSKGLIIHTNHYIKDHPGVEENVQLKDSYARLTRIHELTRSATVDLESIKRMLEDEDGFPTAINRQRTDDSTMATLFSIVMDLDERCADVRMGRPSAAVDTLKLRPLMPTVT